MLKYLFSHERAKKALGLDIRGKEELLDRIYHLEGKLTGNQCIRAIFFIGREHQMLLENGSVVVYVYRSRPVVEPEMKWRWTKMQLRIPHLP